MKILAQARSVVSKSYAVEYVLANDPEISYLFPSDNTGEIEYDAMSVDALDSLMRCQDGTYEVDGPYLIEYEHRHVAKSLGQCLCGGQVVLDSEVNTCVSCGIEYTLNGERLPYLQMVG